MSPRKFLQYNQVLELFPPNIRNAIYAQSEYRDYKPGDYVFHRGDEGHFMAGVMSGRLRMSVSSLEGKEMLITMIERGELFGEMSVLDELPRAVDVVAETDSTLMIIKRDDLMPFFVKCPEAILSITKMICYRMRLYVNTMELIALQSLPVRLARYLLRLSREYGTEQDGRITIAAHLSQAEIGRQLAVSRESINKQLNGFAEKGLLSLNGDDIVLIDIEGLKRAITPISG